MNPRIPFILNLIAFFGVLCGSSTAADLILVAKNTPPAPIIVYQDAPPRTRDAAVTLAESIEKICGRKPAVLDGKQKPLPDRAIWVGVQPAVKILFPQTDFDFKHAEETLIVASERHLVIAGRDRWNPTHMEAKGRLAMKTGIQQEYGTANAVYSFIQEQLGVRWLWPGEEDVIQNERIAIAPMERRYHPQIRSRGGMLVKTSLGDNKESAEELWARFQRVQLDSMDMSGGHGYGDWWEKYGETHPDYFAAAPDGSRKPVKPSVSNTKLCASNPKVWQQWLEDISVKVRADPLLRVINVSPNDGYTSGHCTCSNCLAWDHPDGEKVEWGFGGGVKYQGVSQTDRDVRFANTLARLLKDRFPERELFVQLNAYGLARNPPIAIKPDDNVIISSVANFHLRSPAERKLPMSQHAGWAKVSKHLLWRPNLGSPAGLSWGMPDVAMTQAGEEARALVAVSEDYGRTWSPSRPSNLPMATSKPCAGTLSTGQRFLIGSTSADGGKRRSPLTIAVSKPGETRLSQVFVIRHAEFPSGPGESHVKAALSYPCAIEHEGKLYVGYSNSGGGVGRVGLGRELWNNNSAEMAVIPLEKLKANP